MITEVKIAKALNLTKADKGRAWDVLIGYNLNHLEKCKDPLCAICNGIEGAVDFVEEYPTEG